MYQFSWQGSDYYFQMIAVTNVNDIHTSHSLVIVHIWFIQDLQKIFLTKGCWCHAYEGVPFLMETFQQF